MSTHFSSALMSGNFDFPPATMDTNPARNDARPATIDPRFTSRNHPNMDWAADLRRHQQNLEALSRQNSRRLAQAREEQRLLLATAGTRRQLHEDQAAALQNFPTSEVRPRVLGSRLRRRLAAGQSSSQRNPVRFGSATFGLDLLDPPLPRMDSLDVASAEYSGEAEVNRRRKRPKLDHNHLSSESQKFHYDWKGRTVSGRLKMQIHDCDGGLLPDPSNHHAERYQLENVLVNDQSVYCTKRNRCNIVFKHLGDACFSLAKIIIKAPATGFTAPIQEGLVFVGMDADDLVRRTSQYQFSHHMSEDDSDNESSLPSLTTEERPQSRRRDSSSRVVPPAISNDASRTHDLAPDQRQRSATRHSNQIPGSSSRSRRNDSPFECPPEDLEFVPSRRSAESFVVKYHCNEPSDDEEEASSPSTLADRYEREQMPTSIAQASDDDDDQIVESNGRLYRYPPTGSAPPYLGRAYKSRLPSHLEIVRPEHEDETDEEILPPLAKFFIEKEKNVVSISFDPPVSGKYVLLKLYSTIENQNIDIQSVGIYGYAGPRTFAASQML